MDSIQSSFQGIFKPLSHAPSNTKTISIQLEEISYIVAKTILIDLPNHAIQSLKHFNFIVEIGERLLCLIAKVQDLFLEYLKKEKKITP